MSANQVLQWEIDPSELSNLQVGDFVFLVRPVEESQVLQGLFQTGMAYRVVRIDEHTDHIDIEDHINDIQFVTSVDPSKYVRLVS